MDLADAQPAQDHKQGADTGIDDYINFFDDMSDKAKQVLVQVKSGYAGVSHVHDLLGVLEREKAAIGALITLREPTGPMITEAAAAGFYEPKDFPGRYPRLQILTIAEILAGRNLRQSRAEDQVAAGGAFLVLAPPLRQRFSVLVRITSVILPPPLWRVLCSPPWLY